MKLTTKLLVGSLFAACAFSTPSLGQNPNGNARMFPYELNLGTTVKSPYIKDIIGTNSPIGAERYTANGLVLTKAINSSTSGFTLDEIPFSSANGIEVEFEYAMYDGTPYAGNYGDGISFFLYDGSYPATVGAYGAGLGYSYKEVQKGYESPEIPGMEGAYLGIGVDTYGNFKRHFGTPTEIREGIFLNQGETYRNNGFNHLTIRGANQQGNNMKGYPVLFTTQLDNLSTGSTDNGYTTSYLNTASGTYRQSQTVQSPSITMRPNKDAYGNILYNTIKLILIPNAAGTSTYISVIAQDQNHSNQVLTNFEYPNTFKAPYWDGTVYDFVTHLPSTFKIGFAGSTGLASQANVIKRVKVSLPYGPQPQPDYAAYCIGSTDKTVVLYPFRNDVFYTGKIANPTPGNDSTHIDYTSFRFEDAKGFALDASNPYTYKTAKGQWNYNPNTQAVTFTLLDQNADNVDNTIYYSAYGTNVNGGPFHNEYYRSAPTAITVHTAICTVPVNPSLRTKRK